ncbi:MAG: hypothetical protein RR971_02090, partial [Alistipes sp.]
MVMISEPEPESEPEMEVISEPEPEPEVAPVPTHRAATETASVPNSPTLFGTDDLLRHRQKQRVMMSLYDIEEPVPAPVAAPAPQPIVEKSTVATEPAREESATVESAIVRPASALTCDEDDDMMIEEIDLDDEQEEEVAVDVPVQKAADRELYAVLGEVMNHDKQTLSDTLATAHDHASHATNDLCKMVGINDRFLMIRDLFDGNTGAYNQAIDILNGFDDLDDCMIYIAENYVWNANSDGAKLLMKLIERKLS